MTPEQTEQERAEFEAWHKETFGYLPKKYKDGTFMSSSRADEVSPQDMFEGWIARAEQTGWISVADRLPEINSYVLAATHRGLVIIDRVCDYGRGKEWVSGHFDNPITHWQPLPQPPKGGAK